MTTDFTGRVALVTGGGSGIGEAVARRLGAEGASVVVMDRDEAGARRVAGELARASAFVGDVTDPMAGEAAVAHALDTFGGLHIGANIAGISGPQLSTEAYPLDAWDEIIAVNLSGVYYTMRAQLRHMVQAGSGAIVNMASMFSLLAREHMPAYITSKHGVLGMTRAAAIDCGPRGVRVNCVAPAVIETPLLWANLDQAVADHLASLNPSGRLGTVDEVAAVAVFLASDAASFVNGACYTVDGAFTAR